MSGVREVRMEEESAAPRARAPAHLAARLRLAARRAEVGSCQIGAYDLDSAAKLRGVRIGVVVPMSLSSPGAGSTRWSVG
jgi:hypothetical protein